jgi:soluble lytic murein transglycosylase
MRLPLSHASISEKVPSQLRAFVLAASPELSGRLEHMRYFRLFCIISCSLLVSGVADEAAKRSSQNPSTRLGQYSSMQHGQNSWPAWGSAQAAEQSLNSCLKDWQDLPNDAFIAKLREYRSSWTLPGKERQESAYVLGRALQKSLNQSPSSNNSPYGASSNVGGDNPVAKEAIGLLQEASKLNPLWQRSQEHIIEVATACKLETELQTHLQMIVARTGLADKSDSLDQTEAAYALAQSFFRTNDLDQAKSTFLEIKKEAPKSKLAIGANYYLGQIDIMQNQPAGAADSNLITDAALKYFRQYLHECPDGRFAREITNRLINAAGAASGRAPVDPDNAAGAQIQSSSAPASTSFAPAIPAADRELFGRVFFACGAYSDALKQWDLAGDTSKLTERAICYAHMGRSKEAKEYLFKSIRAGNSYAGAAALISGPLTRQQTIDFYKEILAASPNQQEIPLWNIGYRLMVDQPGEAQPYLQKLIRLYPTSEFAPESLWWMFWHQAKPHLKDPAKLGPSLALAHQGMQKYPTTKAAAKLAFWAGKLDELMQKPESARIDYQFACKNFPSYYYGHRAKARLALLSAIAKVRTDRGWSTRPDRRMVPAEWQWPDADQFLKDGEFAKRYGSTAALLLKLRQFDECIKELPAEVSPEVKATIYAAANDNAGAIRAAGKTLEGRPSGSERWAMTYPRAYDQEVNEDAKTENLDPFLVLALIREESRFNPLAFSRSRAIGLMQLLPGTADGVAKNIGIHISGSGRVLRPDFTIKDANNVDAFKPEINIKLGTHYLASVLSRANGNALLAVASYNGGPGAVQKWLGQHRAAGYADFDSFVENIPYRETRDYVRKVFGSYWTYEEVYEASDKSS